MTLKTVKNTATGSIYEIDEDASLVDMQDSCPLFFKNSHGKRETYTTYRGCLIVRSTANFGGVKTRHTSVFAFHNSPSKFPSWGEPETRFPSWEKALPRDLFCISAGSPCSSVAQAKRLIDTLLDGGEYYYGFG